MMGVKTESWLLSSLLWHSMFFLGYGIVETTRISFVKDPTD